MHRQTTGDGAGLIRDDAQNQTAEKGRNALEQRFAEMDAAIKNRQRQNRRRSGITGKRKKQETAEEQLDRDKINAVTDFVQQLKPAEMLRVRCDESDLL